MRAMIPLLGAAMLAACNTTGVTKENFMASPIGMSQENNIRVQRPGRPATQLIAWTQDDRLFRDVTLDYVSGMSMRSYFFEEANQLVYRPMLGWALNEAGLLAANPSTARYGLQIEFQNLDNSIIGVDLKGESSATYRIVDRYSNTVVFETLVESNFLAIYPGLNEADADLAYRASIFGMAAGLVVAASEDDQEFETYLWGTVAGAAVGPAVVLLEQLNPFNYISSADYFGWGASEAALGTLDGPLSDSGISGFRNGAARARQANSHMLAQSITKFVVLLAASEELAPTIIVPCRDTAANRQTQMELLVAGYNVRSRSCLEERDREPANGLLLTAPR